MGILKSISLETSLKTSMSFEIGMALESRGI